MKTEATLTDGIYSHFFNLTVLIAGLGYFIDTFDAFLYNSMRVVSLTELGLSGDALTKAGLTILNCQVLGTLLGSFFWGILGDKIGRKKALVGSIFIYSLFMIANGFVQDVTSYAVVRFIIGFGVAGEVGLGASLVAETIHPAKRTYALMLFTVLGAIGVVVAATSIEWMSWRNSCFTGGVLGLALLTLRSTLFESRLYNSLANSSARRGSLRDLFGNWQNLKKYLLCIPLLASNYFVTGILLTLSPEVAKASGTPGVIKANIALAIYFVMAIFGDWLGAWLNDRLHSRRKVAALFIAGNAGLACLILQPLHLDAPFFYGLCAACGLFNLWAISGTILVEQFPTALRATASTSNLNCSRATIFLMNLSLLSLKPYGIAHGLLIIGCTLFTMALGSVWGLSESYGQELDRREHENAHAS